MCRDTDWDFHNYSCRLDVATPLPDDGELAVSLGSVRTQPAVASLAEPHRERIVTRWWDQGIRGTAIHAALVRNCRPISVTAFRG